MSGLAVTPPPLISSAMFGGVGGSLYHAAAAVAGVLLYVVGGSITAALCCCYKAGVRLHEELLITRVLITIHRKNTLHNNTTQAKDMIWLVTF